MLRRKAEHTLTRVIAVYAGGVLAGTQIALYLFDLYDEGTADIRSLLIGLLFLALGLGFASWPFRHAAHGKRPNKAPEPTPGSVTPRATSGNSK